MMHRISLAIAFLCFAVAVVIIIFAEGLRVYYSGGLFIVLGVVSLINARRFKRRDSSRG
jgi:hypothetical protein